ncbi:protein-export membrane protein SecF [Leptolyngbya sp. 'hensonii']|uniref:protein translocase subunit SecF n=1 Tax=Leptolyngbya sp. 'hensonii' TaxID=1922337 RepID=UPI0009501D7E|nr:protein translocase subunit SecF [Leptolyngbya sp. 'hensonii']OLP19985.1 protein-export membrane protein SecF [Leptolyngbya sp. 'hensonii']
MRLQIIRQRSIWWSLSIIVILSGLVSMAISWQQIGSPLRPGLDFVGGTRLQFELACNKAKTCTQPIDPAVVRELLNNQNLGTSSIQVVDKYALSIRSRTLDVEQRNRVKQVLEAKLGAFDEQKTQIDTVGPALGKQLFTTGMLALGLSFLGIALYLTVRFQPDYAFFAIVALFHDVLITVGVFSILGLVMGKEVDSLFVVALLTIIGFSVNDTVVIYDRIRETITLNPTRHIDDIVDDAVNQTLTRSINTTLTVLLTLTSIFLFGGETLKDFALALIIGFTMGAYSSIFIASTLLALWRELTGKVIPLAVEGSASEESTASLEDS